MKGPEEIKAEVSNNPIDNVAEYDNSQRERTGLEGTGEADSRDMLKLAIARILRIEKINDIHHQSDRLDKIIDWAKGKGALNKTDISVELTHLRNRLGNPTIYELIAYIGLENERNSLENRQKDIREKMGKMNAIG